MFMNWKIPSRILDNPSQERTYSAVPSLSPAQKPEDITRHATLPEIHLTNNLNNRPASQMSIKSRRIPSRTLGTPVNSARLYREQNPSADTWALQMEKTNQAKKSISKDLRTQDDQKYRMVGIIRKSLDPEGRKMVDEWLANATAKDRKMALKLFSTLENNNLPDTEKQIRIEGILQLIKRKDQGYGTPEINTHFKHLRLQDAETRATRWMHTTWHHLPQYRDNDPVANPSSMYTKPHEPTPYDFVIHPDWG